MCCCSFGSTVIAPLYKESQSIVMTDHQALKWNLHLKESFRSLETWPLRLEEFDFDIFYRAGIVYQTADALFQLPTTIG